MAATGDGGLMGRDGSTSQAVLSVCEWYVNLNCFLTDSESHELNSGGGILIIYLFDLTAYFKRTGSILSLF